MSSPQLTLRQRVTTPVIGAVLTGLSAAGRLHPMARRWRDGVEVFRDIPYMEGFGPQHTLDVYRPTRRTGPLPVVLYIHGGGFSLLSKDTHWMFGYGFARQGYVVVSINYTLAGVAPYPAAVIDACAAWEWVLDRVADYGGDPSRMVVAGESAGANLALSLMIAQCWLRPEPWAARVFERAAEVGVARAVVPACGMLEVSTPERYLSRRDLPRWMRDRIAVVCRRYLPALSADPDGYALADPVRFLESVGPPARGLPPIFAPCGTRDPVKDDTRRLGDALARHPGTEQIAWYRGGIHAFQAFIWRPLARQCWDDQLRWLRARV